VTVYLDLIILLNFAIDLLLLLGTEKMCGQFVPLGRITLAAFLGGIYGGACLLPGMHFLGNIVWRTSCLCGMSLIAFGFSRSAICKGIVFVILSMALGGLSVGFSGIDWAPVLGGCVLCILCYIAFRVWTGIDTYLPVELQYGNRCIQLTALRDTGNTLRDPITGRPVLIVSAEIADMLIGLSKEQLCSPVDAIGCLPGMRLIPYKTVGQEGGFLLAMKLPKVRIGTWKGSALVAFAPIVLNAEGKYQALTGGSI